MRKCNLKESDNIEKLFYCQVRVPYKHDRYSLSGSNYSDYCENDKKFEWVTQKGWYVNYLENFRIDTEPFIEKALKLSKNEWKHRFKNYFEMENPGRFFTFIPAIEEGSKMAVVYFEKSRYPGTLSLSDIKHDLKQAGLVLNRVEEKKSRYNKVFYKLYIIINNEDDLKTLNQFVLAKKDISEISFTSPNSFNSNNPYELTADMLESMIMHRDAENEPKLMIAASKMKPGDIVYNENNGHRLEVVDINKGNFGRVKIKFFDLDNNGKQITRLHDIRDMWELADEGDVAYEVDDEDFIVEDYSEEEPDWSKIRRNKKAIVDIYNETFDQGPLICANEIIDKLGYNDAREIIATMVIAKSGDGRISDEVRHWADSIVPFTEYGLMQDGIYYCDDIHPTHFDQIASAMMDA